MWSLVSGVAVALLLGDVVGSLLSLNAAYIEASQALTFLAFAGVFPLFGIVVFTAASRHGSRWPRLSWLVRTEDDDGNWATSLPVAVAALAIVCFVVIALLFVATIDKFGGGAPEQINGKYYLIDHGERTEISRSDYAAAATADARFCGLIASVFLGAIAVTAGARRNILKGRLDQAPAEGTASSRRR